MKYIAQARKSTKLTFGYDFSESSSYSSSLVHSNNLNSKVFTIIDQMGFDSSVSTNHSGEFLKDFSNITGHFIDGYSSLGANFNRDSYVEVKNKTLNDEVGGTFIFSHEKKSKGTEIIFSNYSNDILDPRGFELGINDANKLFFECQSSSGPSVFVLNNIPHKKNIYYVSVNSLAGSVNLSWWDSYEEQFESESFIYEPGYVQPSDSWVVGSGKYMGESSLDYSSEGYPCDGYIDKFLHFDEVIPPDDVALIVKSFYEDLEFFPPTSGQYDPYITGYNQVVDEVVMGITGYEMVITGYREAQVDTYQYITGNNMYGAIVSGESYYSLDHEVGPVGPVSGDITGIYRKFVADSPSYEITGFNTGYALGTYTKGKEEPLYNYSGVEGVKYTTYKNEAAFTEGGYYRISESYYDLSGSAPIAMSDGLNGYGPKSYTYLGARDSSADFIETQKGLNMFSVNNFASIGAPERSNLPEVVLNGQYEFNTEDLSLVMNGLTKQKGEFDKVQSEDFEYSTEVVSGEFCVHDDGEDYDFADVRILFSDENLSLYVDDPVVDILDGGGGDQSFIVSNTSQYGSAPFSEINPEGKNVFINGQKIYKDIDYEIVDGKFNPIGEVLNITGTFHTTSNWRFDEDASIVSSVTGLGNYDIHETSPFLLSSYLSYLNGVRLDPKAFVCHDSSVDLLEQGKSFMSGKQYYEIYNNYEIDRLGHDTATAGGIAMTGIDPLLVGTVDDNGRVIDEEGGYMPYGSMPIEVDPEEAWEGLDE